MRTTGKQCGLAATGVYQPSLRSPWLAADDAVILPFYLRGLWGSRFSRSSSQLQENRNTRLRSQIIVAFGKPMPIHATAVEVKHRVSEISIDAWEQHTKHLDPLALAWLKTAKKRGSAITVAEARGKQTLSSRRFMAGVFTFSRLMKKRSPEQNIGLLIPTSTAGLMTNMAALLLGKTVVNLNYTASLQALQSSLDKAEIRSIYTSRQFIKKLAARGLDMTPLFAHVDVYYLEDLAGEISTLGKLWLLVCATVLPAGWLYMLYGRRIPIEAPAAILFSSGSEGEPKGVLLSQRNIMANIRQVSDVLDTQADDTIMATLPLFHAFWADGHGADASGGRHPCGLPSRSYRYASHRQGHCHIQCHHPVRHFHFPAPVHCQPPGASPDAGVPARRGRGG
nr:AMP-binding protein [Thiolapillus sp.]